MNTNLIFFDVDGTIITEDHVIPPSAVTAIRRARQAGNLCVVNTGRPYSHIAPQVRAIGFSGYICSCGQHVVLQDRVVYHTDFSGAQSARIAALVRACELDAVFETESGVWFLRSRTPCPQLVNSIGHYERLGFSTTRDVEASDFCFDKFCVWRTAGGDIPRFLRQIEPLCEIIFRENDLIELVKKGCSKQTGMRLLMDRLHIAPDRCYAIGDSTNDIPMLRCVPHSIAMGNAPEPVKQIAEHVTAPIGEDGLAKAMAHYGLLSRNEAPL